MDRIMLELFFQMRAPHHYRGFCRIPYLSPMTEDSMISGKFENQNSPPKSVCTSFSINGHVSCKVAI